MQKLSLLANVLKSNGIVLRQSLTPCTRVVARSFATGEEGGEGRKEEAPPVDPFLQNQSRGSIYAKLTGIGKNTLKTDIIHFLEGCHLTTEDVRVEYNRTFASLSMILRFPSRSVFQNAIRSTTRKGRLYKLEEVDRGQWDIQTSYDGQSVLLSGIPRNALAEDVERFLCGCDYDASSLQMFVRGGFPEPIRMATVRFPSQIDATNAIRMKNRGFILNNLVTMKLLQ
ncbi:hypothetical protein H6P81_006647 [Aristolochia fimbriata]|uniref:Ribosomal protein S24e family protein n=1 Tax=Aristolochia fimbriata TaxID=158543 RepID=A0AAV7EY50_ARIFI|nr:hypothetical protein H6P81_006647 [Aristolochia fimbriata]